MIRIQLIDAQGSVLFSETGGRAANLVLDREYAPGDCVLIDAEPAGHVHVQIDAAVPPAMVYLPEGKMRFAIPNGEMLSAYAPQAFRGERHLIAVRAAEDYEKAQYRDVARNPVDQSGQTLAFPHVHANAETRGESVFAARNVIDGMLANHSHGEWPYESWGVDIAFDARITLEFGRPVTVDAIGICLRADFPHDSWWTQATLALSDGSSQVFSLTKTDAVQRIAIGTHTITWARIENLVKKDEPALFPALIEWEVYGKDA